jgi:D-alanyl-D-alanine carboxypeptidase
MRSRKKTRQLAFRKVQWILIPVALVVCLFAGGFWLKSYLDSPSGTGAQSKSHLQSDTSTSDTREASPSTEVTISTTAASSSETTAVSTTESTQVPTPKASSTSTPTPTPSPKPTTAPVPTGPVWYDGFVDPRTVDYEIVSTPGDTTVLINKYYAVSEDYSPELVDAESSNSQKLCPEVDEAWDLMRQACETDTGKVLYLTAGYSTFPQRLALFEGAIKKVNDGVSGFTMKRVVSKYAYPGRSEHNVGLAIDIREVNDSSISSNFLNTVAGAWVAEHAHEYGFILRYPSGKGHITGYDFEAWHFRYVGVDLATTLYGTGQTLEEYYGKEQVMP